MEQYIHTLIAADSQYVPTSTQVAEFFETLVRDFSFRVICNKRFQPGLRVVKPGGKTRTWTNTSTGETSSYPVDDHIAIETASEIPPLIENLAQYRVRESGEWEPGDTPLVLLKAIDRLPFEGNYLCDVSCDVRPAPVSTSAWDCEAGPNVRNVPSFGSAWSSETKTGFFPNPWTGEVIEVPNAGSARFWIEFEFGKFIYPRIDNSLAVLSPSLAEKAKECFQTEFAQGCRFW